MIHVVDIKPHILSREVLHLVSIVNFAVLHVHLFTISHCLSSLCIMMKFFVSA